MASFDPYLAWLGIRPEDQPPDHYRLLGVKPHEPDPDVIVRAAKRQMARVKNAQTGNVAHLAQHILKEIALARNCLLDPVKRAEYDRELRTRLGQKESTARPVRLAEAARQKETVGGRSIDTRPSDLQTASRLSKNGPRSRLIPILLGGIAGTLLAVAILFAIRGRPARLAEQESPPAAESQPAVAPAQPDPQVSEPGELAAHAPTPRAEQEEEATIQRPRDADAPSTPEPAQSDAPLDDGQTRQTDDETSDSESQKGQSAENGQGEADAAPESEPEQPPAETPARPKRLPVPDDPTQRQAEQRVRELLQTEFHAANTPEQKAALATRLVKLGRETTGDPATRFVLFRLAYELTAAMGDWAKALSIVDTMGEHYEADVLAIKAEVLGQVVEGLQVTPQTAEAVKEVLSAVSTGLDDAVAADNYGAANRFLRSARVLARKVGNPAMTRELGVREREIGRMERAFERVKTALDSVARGSADPASNLEAGRWFCFEKGNWKKGLPLLAKGSDTPLADLARRDLANPADYRQQIQLAEHWLQAAKGEPSSSASRIVSRAQHWCDQAMLKLEEAVANDDYDTAGRLLSVAVSVAREADDRELVTELTSRQKELDRLEQRFAAVKGSLETLAADPDNPEANQAVGQWYCFDKGLWEKGLPLLAKGADSDLASLAQRDAADPDTPSEELNLADDWWKRAENERGAAKQAIESRAVHWYRESLPKLTGLDKVRVEKRLAAGAARTSGPAQVEQNGVVQEGNVALASNGTTVSGPIGGSAALLDGDALNYDGVEGYAHGKWPCEWTVTFDRVYLLQEIRLLLWDGDSRHFRYAITTSPDGQTYAPAVDRSQGAWRGWQQIRFSPRPVKSVKLMGLYNSLGQGFQIVEFEAYCIPPKSIKGP